MQASKLSITVVIPAYNAAKTIARAVQSCTAQTLQPLEIIVVDDGSKDNTIDIARQSFPGIIIVSLEGNRGPSVARNAGWDIAKGDIIAFLDSDDEWHPQKLEIIAGLFDANKNAVFIGHPYTLRANNTRYNTQSTLHSKSWLSILLRNPFQTSCISIQKNIPYRFDNNYRYCEDHELAVRIAHDKRCYYINYPLTILGRPQLSKGGASANLWKMRKGQLSIYTGITRYSIIYAVFLPILWLYSLSKHIMQWIRLQIS